MACSSFAAASGAASFYLRPLGVLALGPHIRRTPEPLKAPPVDPLFAHIAHEDGLVPS
jgi:hypothetical protein